MSAVGAWSAVLGNIFPKKKKKPLNKSASNIVLWITFESLDGTKRVDFNISSADFINDIRIDNDKIFYYGIVLKKIGLYQTINGKRID